MVMSDKRKVGEPRREKSTMDKPQEEFIEQQSIPSHEKRPDDKIERKERNGGGNLPGDKSNGARRNIRLDV